MRDLNGNGKVDQVTVVFDDVLAAYSAGIAPWALSNVPAGGSLSSVTVSGNTATLTITEGPSAATTAVGGFTVALASNSAGIRDVYNHTTSFAASAPSDMAAPVALAMTMSDGNGNGKVDRVTALFSETLQAYTAGTTPWTLANVPSAGTLSSVGLSSATLALTLTLTEGAGAADTSVGTMTVAMAANAAGARDATGNLRAWTASAPLDAAGPVVVTITDTNGTTDGKAQAGDTLVVTFSETLAPASLPSSTTDTLTDPVGAGNDTLTIAGVTNGARTTGGANYVSLDGGVASFASSAVVLSNANRTLTVTIGAVCSGAGCAALGTEATAATLSFVAATTITDVAGNVAATTAKTASLRLF